MKSDLWFVRKKYGWGWTPANAKGWLTLAFFFAAMNVYPVLCGLGWFDFSMPVFFAITVLISLLLVAICYATGEKPSWQWGGGKE